MNGKPSPSATLKGRQRRFSHHYIALSPHYTVGFTGCVGSENARQSALDSLKSDLAKHVLGQKHLGMTIQYLIMIKKQCVI